MRIHLALVLSTSFLAFACTNRPSSNPSTRSDEVLLEIVTNGTGVVYPRQGDILDFRLHESGCFEYEDYPAQNPPSTTAGSVVITRKQAKVSAEDVRELIDLAEQPDFLAARESYPRLHPHVDDQWITTITFTHEAHQKRIAAIDFRDILSHPEDRAKYPASLVKLLERVRELKAKATGNLNRLSTRAPG